jgi:hypothetical protein
VALQARRRSQADRLGYTWALVLQENGRSFGRTGWKRDDCVATASEEFEEKGLKEICHRSGIYFGFFSCNQYHIDTDIQNMCSLAAKHLMLFSFKPHLAALVFIAAGSISQALGQAGGIINGFALIGAFGGLVFAGWQAKMGRTEMIKYGLLGSALCGLAWEPVGFEGGAETEACASNSKCCGPLDRLLKLRCAEKFIERPAENDCRVGSAARQERAQPVW